MKKVILVVEDTSEIREAVKVYLEEVLGYEIITAVGGALALQMLRKEKPHLDAAVLDIMMMGHGGTVGDFLKKEYKGIPIIYHTALTREQFDNRLLEGAYYIYKGEERGLKKLGEILQKTLS